MDASLRTIAAKLKQAPILLYVRFKDLRTGLFARHCGAAFSEDSCPEAWMYRNIPFFFDSKRTAQGGWEVFSDAMLGMLTYIYDHFDDSVFCWILPMGTKVYDFVGSPSYPWKRSTHGSGWRQRGFPFGTCGRADCGILPHDVTAYFEGISKWSRHGMDRRWRRNMSQMGKLPIMGILANSSGKNGGNKIILNGCPELANSRQP